jgi:tetratricopeptide (TPR) repeat protein
MRLTVDQALQNAVEAHKAGKLQDAETLYRAILQAQPKHPDANHNLGVLAVSVNKPEAALPLFKTALEANPNQEQFWISYVDALLKEKQYDNARSVLEQGKKRGLEGEKFDALEAQISSNLLIQNSQSLLESKNPTITQQNKKTFTEKDKKRNSSSNKINPNQVCNPSQVELNTLLAHYQKGQYNLAENLAKEITEKYPKHQFSWKVLGLIFTQTGRLQESLVANQKAVKISPHDAEAHNNFGITLKDLGRLKAAEASYKKAISIKPDYAEAHNNLGNALKELGKLEDALKSYKNAISIKPDYAQAHYNLGSTLQELSRLEEAEASYKKAIASKPDLVDAYYNLGILLYEARRYAQAAEYLKLINFEHSQSYLLRSLYFLNEQSLFEKQLNHLIQKGEISAMIGSLTCHAELRYGIVKPNLFCSDPLKYVWTSNLTKQYDFLNIFVKPATTILSGNRSRNREQGILINGRQTSGNLFSIENDLTIEIKKIIHAEIKKYLIYFKDSDEGLIKHWPTDYSLYAWLISMKSGGELRPHMHEFGWISGSIYINVPPKSKANDGNLVVCLGHEDYHSDGYKNRKNIIDVTTGSLCLFPASLLHYTIPFESDEDRIVLAFDVKPK